MFELISNNLSTILVSALLVLAVILVIAKLHRDKKNGKSSCGGNCHGCPSAGICHKK